MLPHFPFIRKRAARGCGANDLGDPFMIARRSGVTGLGDPFIHGNWSPGVRPEIWFQCCFYKEPIGTKSAAGAAGAAHKAREKQAPARARPEVLYDINGFSLKHHWLLVLVKSVKATHPGQRLYYLGIYVKVVSSSFA